MAIGGEGFLPERRNTGKLSAQNSADLFPTLLKTGPHQPLEVSGKYHRRRLPHQMEQVGFDVGTRIETAGSHGVTRRHVVGRLQENGDRAEGFRSGFCSVTLRR